MRAEELRFSSHLPITTVHVACGVACCRARVRARANDEERGVLTANDTRSRIRRSSRIGRRGLAVLAAAAVVLVLLGTVAYAAVKPTDDDALHALARSGRVRIKNNHGGDALVGMRGMLPGDSTSGTVRIGNASKVRARFYLGLSKLVEAPGTGGGRLSYRLVLTVKRLAANRRPQLVYTGPLREMPMLKLGLFKARESRIYHFSVLFPEGGAAMDDGYQQASTSLQFNWYARRAR